MAHNEAKRHQSPLLTVNETAEYLSVSRSTIYRLVERAEVPSHKVGGQIRFDRDELRSYIHREEQS